MGIVVDCRSRFGQPRFSGNTSDGTAFYAKGIYEIPVPTVAPDMLGNFFYAQGETSDQLGIRGWYRIIGQRGSVLIVEKALPLWLKVVAAITPILFVLFCYSYYLANVA